MLRTAISLVGSEKVLSDVMIGRECTIKNVSIVSKDFYSTQNATQDPHTERNLYHCGFPMALILAPNVHRINGAGKPNTRAMKASVLFPHPQPRR